MTRKQLAALEKKTKKGIELKETIDEGRRAIRALKETGYDARVLVQIGYGRRWRLTTKPLRDKLIDVLSAEIDRAAEELANL